MNQFIIWNRLVKSISFKSKHYTTRHLYIYIYIYICYYTQNATLELLYKRKLAFYVTTFMLADIKWRHFKEYIFLQTMFIAQ